MVPLGGGTILIDTPGLRVFPIGHIPRGELGRCFREFVPIAPSCRFRDCMHDAEPGCAVSDAVERGEISPGRLASYRELLRELSGG